MRVEKKENRIRVENEERYIREERRKIEKSNRIRWRRGKVNRKRRGEKEKSYSILTKLF